MCSIYASAVRRMLPGAQLVVGLFHVVQLAVKMTGDVRRRVVRGKYGRRGRSGDPEYGAGGWSGRAVRGARGAVTSSGSESRGSKPGPGRHGARPGSAFSQSLGSSMGAWRRVRGMILS